MKILFLGSSRFSKIVLEKMIELGANVVAAITQPDRPSGRGHVQTPTLVKSFCQTRGIEVFTFDKVRLHMQEVKAIDYDLAVVASFGQILPEEFLSHRLAINVHPSLLPKYRGATPIQSALLNGDKMTGVTIMKVAKAVDAGDIILQKELPIGEEYYLELEEKLAVLGGELVMEAVAEIEQGRAKFTPQNDEMATLVQKLSKADGELDFSQTAAQLVGRVRALSEEIGCSFSVEGLPVKVKKLCDVSDNFSCSPGEVLQNKKRFVIGCSGGAVEIVSCLSPSGKTISGRDFLNGHNEVLGKKVDESK